jgi:hypothetical protein
MSSMYSGSTCTIAAHGAKDDSEGFLIAALEPVPSLKLPPRPRLNDASFSILQRLTSRSLSLGGSFREQVNESFLTRRGWVFQERILSRRILHFTRHHVFFEDVSGVHAVDVGTSHPPWTHQPWKDGKLVVQDVVATIVDWYKLVERYSICALTFDRDRLPAIAGIARFVVSYDFAGECFFGLCSKSLHQGLLWVASDNSPQDVFYGPDYDGLPRPSFWSCARWKGSILFPRHIAGSTPLFQLVDNFAPLTLLDSSPAQDPRFLTSELK